MPSLRLVLAACCLLGLFHPQSVQAQEPIIDMHMHALHVDDQGPPPLGMCTPLAGMPAWDPATPYPPVLMGMFTHPACPDPLWSPTKEEDLVQQNLAAMEKLNVIGVVSGADDRIAALRALAPQRVIPGMGNNLMLPSLDVVRAQHAAGNLAVLGEISAQYLGVAADDPKLEPYWALAEELDIPVALHIGPGPPGVIYMGAQGYRARLHSPLQLEEVLVKHPKLRVDVMHAGFPMLDDTLALLYAHPQVYLDTGVIVYTQPRPAFYRYLQALVDGGFGNRIMFGSDQMVWPGAIERSVNVINEAPFLSAGQKRDILFNNAARFLRLTPAQVEAYRKLGMSAKPAGGKAR